MTDDEKKRMIAAFVKDAVPADDEIADPWDEEAILKTAEKILERMRNEGM